MAQAATAAYTRLAATGSLERREVSQERVRHGGQAAGACIDRRGLEKGFTVDACRVDACQKGVRERRAPEAVSQFRRAQGQPIVGRQYLRSATEGVQCVCVSTVTFGEHTAEHRAGVRTW